MKLTIEIEAVDKDNALDVLYLFSAAIRRDGWNVFEPFKRSFGTAKATWSDGEEIRQQPVTPPGPSVTRFLDLVGTTGCKATTEEVKS